MLNYNFLMCCFTVTIFLHYSDARSIVGTNSAV